MKRLFCYEPSSQSYSSIISSIMAQISVLFKMAMIMYRAIEEGSLNLSITHMVCTYLFWNSCSLLLSTCNWPIGQHAASKPLAPTGLAFISVIHK